MLLLKFDLVQTVAFACFLFVIGLYLYNYFHMQSDINVPPVIVGGIIFVITRLLLKGKINFEFDFTFLEPSYTIFFTIIGFSITADFFKHTKKEIILLLLSATGLIIIQNLVAYFLGKGLGLSPLISLMTGSATLTGGAGTATSVAATLEPLTKTEGLMEVGIAFSSLGVLFASLLGTPFCSQIIKRNNLHTQRSFSTDAKKITKKIFFSEGHAKITLESILMTIFQICLIAGIAITLSNYLSSRKIIIPSILIATFLAICLRALFDHAHKSYISPQLLRFFADFNLMILLALSMMSIDLHNLSNLSLPLLVIFIVQLLLTFAWCYFVTYRLFGSDYNGVFAMSGHIGFGIGTTENALVNIENLSILYEPNPEITFATIAVGAFLIDIININLIYFIFNLLK